MAVDKTIINQIVYVVSTSYTWVDMYKQSDQNQLYREDSRIYKKEEYVKRFSKVQSDQQTNKTNPV